MKKILTVVVIAALATSLAAASYAQRSSAADILRSGLLGAGAGAVGGAVSDGDTNSIWKGALAGAGVNIVGGALLDVISQNSVRQELVCYDSAPSYTSGRTVRYQAPASYARQIDPYTQGYQDGYLEGYKAGFAEGSRKDARQ